MTVSKFFVYAALALLTLVTVLGLLGFAAVYCYTNPIIDVISYRLTLEAEVDGHRVVGSGVIRVDYHYAYLRFLNIDQPSNIPPISPRVTGEAIELDFGDRGALFVTLAPQQHQSFDELTREGNSSAARIVPYAWGQPPILDRPDLVRLHKLSPLKDLSFSRLPLLVCFRDISDFRTIARVDPFDMSSCFGPGVKLISASIELTQDDVTREIESKLPWLSKFLGGDDPIETTKRYFRVEQPAVSGLSWDHFKSGYK